MPKVSIIIPVFNTEKYLLKCLESVVGQTLQDIEIIIINDHSSDNSMEIINHYAFQDKRIKVIDKKVNEGVSQARNDGLDNASGEYIGFVDSDDWISLDMYEQLCTSADKYKSDMVICALNTVVNNEIILPTSQLQNELFTLNDSNLEKYLLDYVISGNHRFELWNKLFKKEIILSSKLRFQKGSRFGEDLYFNLSYLIYAHNICYLNSPLYFYLQRENSVMYITNQNILSSYMDKINVYYQRIIADDNKVLLKILPYLAYHYIDYVFFKKVNNIDGNVFRLAKEIKVLNNYPNLRILMKKLIKDAKSKGKIITALLILSKQYLLLSLFKSIHFKRVMNT